MPEGTWPLITLVVVMGPISFWGNVVPRAFQRIGGTILGSALGLWRSATGVHLSAADVSLVRGGDVPLRLAGAGQETVSGAIDRHHSVGGGVGSPPGEIDTALWRSGDVIFGSFAAGDAVYRHLAAAGVHPLAHPDGQKCHQL